MPFARCFCDEITPQGSSFKGGLICFKCLSGERGSIEGCLLRGGGHIQEYGTVRSEQNSSFVNYNRICQRLGWRFLALSQFQGITNECYKTNFDELIHNILMNKFFIRKCYFKSLEKCEAFILLIWIFKTVFCSPVSETSSNGTPLKQGLFLKCTAFYN